MAKSRAGVVAATMLLTSAVARAQEPEAPPVVPPAPVASPAPPERAVECQPEADAEDVPPSYGDAGVIELGGAIGGMWTEDVFTLNVNPSFGVFVIDYLELSLIASIEYENVRDADGSRHSQTTTALLFEPSYHIPVLDDDLFLFGGLGLGVGYDGVTVGFDVVPRIGANIALGKGRMLNPSVRVPIIMGAEVAEDGQEDFNTSVSVGFELGYSTLF